MQSKELLIWVNDDDEVIGFGEKMDTHVKGILHRAFSLFIYNTFDNTLLIHKRALGKYHSGGLWTNSCCSHPRYGEGLIQAVNRRMQEELGLFNTQMLENSTIISLRELGSFKYYQQYEYCSEHEIDHVFSMVINDTHPSIVFDRNEIESVKWIYMEDLENWYHATPSDFTAWFYQAYTIFKQHIVIGGYHNG